MKRVVLTALATAAVALVADLAVSAPQPKLIPTEWELKFDYQPPQAIQVRVPGESEPRTFWYVLYRVTNQTGRERMYVPNFALYTDSGQVLRAAEGISPSVFEAIQRRHNNPLVESVSGITGMLLQGQDNAKDGVAIFRDIDEQARAFDLFVGGLSGEGVMVKLPVRVKMTEPDVEGRPQEVLKDTIVLQKTLRLHYRLPDDPIRRVGRPAQFDKSDWVMR